MTEQNHSAEIGELVKALIKVQAAMQTAKKKSKNPFFHSTYADLVEITEVSRKLLVDNGFAVIQSTRMAENGDVCVITTLAHTSQQWWSGELCGKASKIVKNKETGEEKEVMDPQVLGSCVSYLRRYGLSSLIGVVSEGEDDDAEAATKPQRTSKSEPQEPPRIGLIYTEAVNKLLKVFAALGMLEGEIEDFLGHDLTTVSEDEMQKLRKLYKDKTKEKKKPEQKIDKAPSPKTESTTQTFINKIYKPHLEFCLNKLGWDNPNIEAWYRSKGFDDPSVMNDVDLARVMEQLEQEKKCQPFPKDVPI